jgi:hypothetical protein
MADFNNGRFPQETHTQDPNMGDNVPVYWDIYFRLTADHEWDLEFTVDSHTKASNYIREMVNTGSDRRSFDMRPRINTGEVTKTTNTKEEDVYEYTLHMGGNKLIVMTNFLRPLDAEALAHYDGFVQNNNLLDWQDMMGMEMYKESIFAERINTSPDWIYPMMMERVVAKGGLFRIEMHKELATRKDRLLHLMGKASFGYSEPTLEGGTMTLIHVYDKDGEKVPWDRFADFMGLEISNHAKISKRLKELARKTMVWDYCTDAGREPVMEVIEIGIMPAGDERTVDGITIMSESRALRMVKNIRNKKLRRRMYHLIRSGEKVTGSLRVLLEEGLIKGDFIIVADHILLQEYGYVPDLVLFSKMGEIINLKKEFSTNGEWTLWTMNFTNPHHQPMTNDQLLSMFMVGDEPWAFPKDLLKDTFNGMFEEYWDDVAAGRFKPYMKAEWMTEGRVSSNIQPDRLNARITEASVAWEDAGRDLMESGHFISMHAGSFRNRMEKAIYRDRAVRIPVPWSSYVHVTTHSIIEAGGYNLKEEGYDTSKCFWHPPTQRWAVPDRIFARDFKRHGGWDHDDSAIVMIRKFNMPDGTIKTMAIVVRMPCSWGEYSIVEVDTMNFPYYNDKWGEMPTVEYDDRPEFLEDLNQQLTGLPPSNTPLNATYDLAWARYLLGLTCINPGVGRFVNPLIAKFSICHTYFRKQIDSTENVVDVLRQTPNQPAFVAISNAVEDMIAEVINSGKPIDRHIWKTRLGERKLPKDAVVTDDTYFASMMVYMKSMLTEWKRRSQQLETKGRKVISELMIIDTTQNIEWIDHETGNVVTISADDAAIKIWRFYQTQMESYSRAIRDSERRRTVAAMVCDNTVDALMNQPNFMLILIALYKFIHIEGKKDTILFQRPLNKDDLSPMDLFLRTLYSYGLATPWDKQANERMGMDVPEESEFLG